MGKKKKKPDMFMNRVGKDTQSNILEHWSVLKIPALMSAYLWKFLAETSFKMNAPFDPAVLLRENSWPKLVLGKCFPLPFLLTVYRLKVYLNGSSVHQ